jgi:DNA repair exonuclease SbcCD nuclease subunit
MPKHYGRKAYKGIGEKSMKIALVSDIHLLAKTPINRIDNILEDQWKKLEFVFKYCEDSNIELLLQAGDFFDVPRNWDTLHKSILLLSDHYGVQTHSVFGQHDMYMRNSEIVTNRIVLKEFGLIDVVQANHFLYEDSDIQIFGIDFQDDMNVDSIIKSLKLNRNKFHILVIHAGISDAPLYPGHEFSNAGIFLKKYPEFGLILCGDIHKSFTIESKGRYIVNTGCMIRKNKDEYNLTHKPYFCVAEIVDRKIKGIETVYIPHTAKVFDQTEYIDTNSILDDFVSSISTPVLANVNIYTAIHKFIKDNNLDPEVSTILSEVMINE